MTALFLVLGVDKSRWPNVYSYAKAKLDKLRHVQDKLYDSAEARKVRDIAISTTASINGCITKIREVLLETKLKGKCRYLK